MEKGERLCYQQILNRIASTRIASDAQDAANARLFVGGNLEHPNAIGQWRLSLHTVRQVLCTDQGQLRRQGMVNVACNAVRHR